MLPYSRVCSVAVALDLAWTSFFGIIALANGAPIETDGALHWHAALGQDSWTPFFDDLSETASSHRRLDVKVNECMDTSEWFGTRGTGGVNIFKTYFDCDCTGDLSKYYTFHCRLENYCYIDIVDNTTERCVNRNITYDFSVDETTGMINTIERGWHCMDYLKAGPLERFCYRDMNVCSLRMKDQHSFSTEASVAICGDRSILYESDYEPISFDSDHKQSCLEILTDQLGYTNERASELCPVVTMGGKDCLEFGLEKCDEHTDDWVYATTHDCSNIEPCAKTSCQARPISYSRPERTVFVYPECNNLSRETATPSTNVSVTAAATVADISLTSADGSADDQECNELNSRLLNLYDTKHCELARSIVQNGDIMSGIGTALTDDQGDYSNTRDIICETKPSCIDEVSEIAKGFIDKGCPVIGEGMGNFMYPLYYNRWDFQTTTTHFCGPQDCHTLIWKAMNMCPGDVTKVCIDPVPCACFDDLLFLAENVSKDFEEDFIPPSAILWVRVAQEKCSEEGPTDTNDEPAIMSISERSAVASKAAILIATATFLIGHLY